MDKLRSRLELMRLSELKDYAKQVLGPSYYVLKKSSRELDKSDRKEEFIRQILQKQYGNKKDSSSSSSSSEDPSSSESPPVPPPKQQSRRSSSTTRSGALKIEPLEVKKLSSEQKKMYEALMRLNIRGPPGKLDLYKITQKYNIKGRTGANKETKVLTILATAEEQGLTLQDILSEDAPPARRLASRPSSPRESVAEDSRVVPVTRPSSPRESVAEDSPIREVAKTVPKESSSKRGSSKAVSESSDSKQCGGMSYDKLLKQSLTELKDILRNSGVDDPSSVRTKDHAAKLICEAEKGKLCRDDLACDKGRVCDITTKPGVCVKREDASDKFDTFNHMGKTIIGTKTAIANLKKQLNIKSSKKVDSTVPPRRQESPPVSPPPSPKRRVVSPPPSPKARVVSQLPSGPKASKSVELTYEQLLDKRLDELKEILQSKGVEDSSSLNKKEQAAFLASNISKGGLCTIDNKCGDGYICDITTKPGVCVSKKSAESHYGKSYNYKGVEVIGSSKVIKRLQKIAEEKGQDDSIGKDTMIKKASLVTGKDKDIFSSMSDKQIRELLEGYGIVENSSNMKDFVAKKTSTSKSDISKLSLSELIQRASLITDHIIDDIDNDRADRAQMIELLSAWTNKNPSDYKLLSNRAIKDELVKLKKLKESASQSAKPKSFADMRRQQEESDSEALPVVSAKPKTFADMRRQQEDSDSQVLPVVSKKPKSFLDMRTQEKQQSDSQEEEEEEDDEKAEQRPKKASGDINKQDIERVMEQILAGDKQNIDDLAAVQNTVLKCFGLLSA
jgi:hypothetical protein